MNTVELNEGVLDELSSRVPDGQSIVLINLLRYHVQAAYPAGSGNEEMTGREAYRRYSELTLPHLIKVGGQPIWRADMRLCLIGPPGERWDEIILVEYPSRSAFERMIADPDYQSIVIHRTAALEDSRLIVATSPRWIWPPAWWLLKLSLKFRRPG